MTEPVTPAEALTQAVRENMLNDLGHAIDTFLNGSGVHRRQDPLGFTVLIFDFGKADGGMLNYLSNARHEDMIAALREMIAVLEGRAPDIVGHA